MCISFDTSMMSHTKHRDDFEPYQLIVIPQPQNWEVYGISQSWSWLMLNKGEGIWLVIKIMGLAVIKTPYNFQKALAIEITNRDVKHPFV